MCRRSSVPGAEAQAQAVNRKLSRSSSRTQHAAMWVNSVFLASGLLIWDVVAAAMWEYMRCLGFDLEQFRSEIFV